MLTIEQVREVLPHRFPMALLDVVSELVPGRALTASKAVCGNEPWFDGVGGGYPDVLVVESWAQAAGVLVSAGLGPRERDDLVMVFGGATGITIHRPVHPGQVLEHSVRLLREAAGAFVVEGEARADGVPVLDVGRMVLALRPRAVLGGGPERGGQSDG